MTLILPILLMVVSLGISYQACCFYGVLPLDALLLPKFADNSMLMLTRLVLAKYSPLLGVVGIVLAIFLFVAVFRNKDDDRPANTYWFLLVIYIVYLILTII